MRNAYQRGHRDSLLNLAALLDQRARAYTTQADRIGSPLLGSTMAKVQEMNLTWAGAYERAADLARKQAEMMPDDPEVQNADSPE